MKLYGSEKTPHGALLGHTGYRPVTDRLLVSEAPKQDVQESYNSLPSYSSADLSGPVKTVRRCITQHQTRAMSHPDNSVGGGEQSLDHTDE